MIKDNNPFTEKQKIRSTAKQKRGSLCNEERQLLSDKICAHIKIQPWFLQAEKVCFYYPLGSEANILPLAELALKSGKQTAFPRVCGEEMAFYQVSGMEEFSQGAFHVMEPVGNQIVSDTAALILVPGLAFDRQCRRMGYGKGYYDKYFARYPGCRKIGICYELQLIAEVPCSQLDVSMEALATERGMLYASGS